MSGAEIVAVKRFTQPLVDDYRRNKERYDIDYYLAFIISAAERSPHLEALRRMPEYQALTARCTTRKPFTPILCVCASLSDTDLAWLIDSMPSGWARARLMSEQEGRIARRTL
jgi:hypothetical protein